MGEERHSALGSFLILHGTGGNKPDHWQEHLAKDLSLMGADVHYPKMPHPDVPDLGSWLTTLRTALNLVPASARLTVLAHSRGCLLWGHYAASRSVVGPVADRVLLVSPPYAPAVAGSGGWLPLPLDAEGIAGAGRETTIVASDDDDVVTFEQASAYAAALGVPIHLLSGAGHISPFYGYGPWPWVTDWCLGRAGFPPLPNR